MIHCIHRRPPNRFLNQPRSQWSEGDSVGCNKVVARVQAFGVPG